jgi:hypothetical protein
LPDVGLEGPFLEEILGVDVIEYDQGLRGELHALDSKPVLSHLDGFCLDEVKSLTRKRNPQRIGELRGWQTQSHVWVGGEEDRHRSTGCRAMGGGNGHYTGAVVRQCLDPPRDVSFLDE